MPQTFRQTKANLSFLFLDPGESVQFAIRFTESSVEKENLAVWRRIYKKIIA